VYRVSRGIVSSVTKRDKNLFYREANKADRSKYTADANETLITRCECQFLGVRAASEASRRARYLAPAATL